MDNGLRIMKRIEKARKMMKPGYAASIEDLVGIIQHNNDPFAVANNSFNYGYYQGVSAERAGAQDRKKRQQGGKQ